MRHIEINSYIRNHSAEQVFDILADFKCYEDLVDTVESIEILENEGSHQSSWVVHFRNGLLKWVEEDYFRKDELKLEFEQVEGDFDEFFGGWILKQKSDYVSAILLVDFDFGVPSLASIVDPVAERVLVDVTKEILRGLFGNDVFFEKVEDKAVVK
ncbi:type II toxin-antitoxin system RatA family toxin [Alteromonas portus]|uniref:type II toxin-antitoxin system RatA family toxin n=1 Tax=Alteromonas portus TaxID=2565549 RepID=UPI003BF78068